MSGITVLRRSELPFVGSRAPRSRRHRQTARCGIGVFSGATVIHAFAVVSAFTLGGCSLLLDTSTQQCSTNQDCRNRSGPFTNATCENHVCVVHAATSTTSNGGNGGSGGSGAGGGGGGTGGGGDPDASADPVWGCLGHVVMEMPQASMANVALPFWDLIRN